ncbi:MAG: RNA polymerase factor sigma-54 [Pseudomonadota bacterium]
MALAPKLEFKQSQQLVMTPQLQQAIKLLQLSNLELADYIEEQLEKNPFLERDGEQGDRRDETRSTEAAERTGEAREDSSREEAGRDNGLDQTVGEAPGQATAELDADYDNIDPNSAGSDRASDVADGVGAMDWTSAGAGKGPAGEDRAIDATHISDKSLKEHLTEQLHVGTRDPQLLFIGAYLIDLIDDAGYFRDDAEAVAERLGADMDRVTEALALIQTFEPAGVGACNLSECLALQLAERDRLDPAMKAFVDNLELLADGDLKGLIKATGADEEDVRDMIAEVRALTPKPGYAYGGETVQVVVPDVFVTQAADGDWKVELNNETLPRILVNHRYYSTVSSVRQKDADHAYVAENFANANWLAKSLDQRARTILKVAREIVRQQDDFFMRGVRHLRPLNLRTIADAISMHESTVSRVTSNKYMATPRGLFEFKYFFTAAIASSSGGEAHSAEAVRHRIKELVENETPKSVLSDDKIVDVLRADGIDIARRTVAKYREAMNIPSSVQRRRQAARAGL